MANSHSFVAGAQVLHVLCAPDAHESASQVPVRGFQHHATLAYPTCTESRHGSHALPCLRCVPAAWRPDSTVITEVVGGDVQFNFFHRWFDVIFVVSALVSIAVLVVLAKTKTSATRTKLRHGDYKLP